MAVSALLPESAQASAQLQGEVRESTDLEEILKEAAKSILKVPQFLSAVGRAQDPEVQNGLAQINWQDALEAAEKAARQVTWLASVSASLLIDVGRLGSGAFRSRPIDWATQPSLGFPIKGRIGEQSGLRDHLALRERFETLAAEWKADHMFTSSPTEVALHDSYQRIIAMGPAALPFILSDLSDKQAGHWFWALQAISDEDPVPIEHRGLIDEMCEDWRQWGREQGYSC